MHKVYREITPLTPYDCFTLFSRSKTCFDFPLHNHEEMEINLIRYGKGVQRVVGDHTETISDIELTFIGSNLPHGWFDHEFKWNSEMPKVEEITIQFHRDLLDDNLLKRKQLYFIRSMFANAARGISFSEETAMRIYPRFKDLTQKSGFDSVLELLSILHDLSVSRNFRLLSSSTFADGSIRYDSRRIERVFNYLRENYHKNITLEEVARFAGMTEVSFSRFIKKRTGKTFIDSLNELRLSHASRLLIDTTHTIAEIGYRCGFNNLSYFNRIFKKRHGCTPKEFRLTYGGRKTFI